MKVQDEVDLGNGHIIEIGQATWDDAETSVWNRYPTSNGGLSPRGSSEIPLADLNPILKAVADRDLLDLATTAQLIEALAASLTRRASSPSSLQTLLDKITDDNIHKEVDTGAAIGNESW